MRPRARRLRFLALALASTLAAAAACTAETPTWQGANPTPTTSVTPGTNPSTAPFDGWSDPAGVGKPYGTKVNGLITFRGNATRTFYGTGPAVRSNPTKYWSYPENSNMCGPTRISGEVETWCGNGWTGQPAVIEYNNRTWVVTGGYDHHIHFIDGVTGEQILPDFVTGDLVKGSLTLDPDGYPLVYSGSRDGYYRIISFDTAKPKELWRLNGNTIKPKYGDDDWDSAGLIIDDYLFQNSENGNFHVIKLNRGYDAAGKATVKPELLYHIPSWDTELQRAPGAPRDYSVENSVAIYKNVAYFANSAGLVQGWDLSGLKQGKKPNRVFRFWTGDDTDATITIDEQGFLYVGVEYEKHNKRSQEVGQMLKLDPSKPDDPIVWRAFDKKGGVSGVWGTPALYKDIVIFDTDGGDVLGIDRVTGKERWRFKLVRAWSSPVVVDDVLFIGDCTGAFYGYDVANTNADPTRLWSMKAGGCVESTPAVWKGVIYFADRWGKLHAIGAKKP